MILDWDALEARIKAARILDASNDTQGAWNLLSMVDEMIEEAAIK